MAIQDNALDLRIPLDSVSVDRSAYMNASLIPEIPDDPTAQAVKRIEEGIEKLLDERWVNYLSTNEVPESGSDVLVCRQQGTKQWVGVAHYGVFLGYPNFHHGTCVFQDVTHWQYLPAPPKAT